VGWVGACVCVSSLGFIGVDVEARKGKSACDVT
jgi:hypothetical protein